MATRAVHLGLLAADIASDGEAITTASNTFIAVVEAISYTSAWTVFVDIDPATSKVSQRPGVTF
jgi:dTDP-4-amino-4,6-dideoxygalactose transaminase